MALTTPGPVAKATRPPSPPTGAHAALRLLKDVAVQVAGEAEDVADHLIGDHVGEEAAHVGQHARMGDQFGEEVVFEADGRRLHPAQAAGGGQQRRRDLAEEGVGVRHVGQGLRLGRGVDHDHGTGRLRDAGQAFRLDGRVDDEFHGTVVARVDRLLHPRQARRNGSASASPGRASAPPPSASRGTPPRCRPGPRSAQNSAAEYSAIGSGPSSASLRNTSWISSRPPRRQRGRARAHQTFGTLARPNRAARWTAAPRRPAAAASREHVAGPALQAVGDAVRRRQLGRHLQHLRPVPDDRAQARVLLEESDAVKARAAAHVEQQSRRVQRHALGQHRGDVARPAGQGQRQPPRRRLCSIADSTPSR